MLPLLVSFLAEAVRAGAAEQELGGLDFEALPEERQQEIALAIVRREMGIMAVACLVIFLLWRCAPPDRCCLGASSSARAGSAVRRRGGRSAASPSRRSSLEHAAR